MLRKSPVRTPALLAANRRNALKSAGPRTVSGKAPVALNGLKHGRYALSPAPPPAAGRRLGACLALPRRAFGHPSGLRAPQSPVSRLGARGSRVLVPPDPAAEVPRSKARISFEFRCNPLRLLGVSRDCRCCWALLCRRTYGRLIVWERCSGGEAGKWPLP